MATPSFTDDSNSRLTSIYNNLTDHYNSNPNDSRFSSFDAFKKYYSYDNRSTAQQNQLMNWYENNIKGGSSKAIDALTGGSAYKSGSTDTGYKSVPVNNNFTGSSVVDYLNSIGWDSSKAARKKYAALYGIEGYDFSGPKNTELLNKLKTGQIPTTATGTSMGNQMDGNRTMTTDNGTVYGDGSIPTDMGSGTNYGTNLNEPISYSGLWDYSTDDPDRIQQMKNNIIQGYVKTNPELFYDRQRFNDFFHYNDRTSQAQRDMLDDVWNLYSKSNANPFDTTVLDQQKQFEQEKRDSIVKVLTDEVDKLNKKRGEIEGVANKNLKEARERLDNISNEYMANVKKVQDLYDDYFGKSKQALQEKMAGEMAGLSSEMSAKKMSGLLRNSLYGIQQNYNKLFSNLNAEQGGLINELNKAYGDFMLQLENHRDNLNSNEYSMLTDGYNNLKAGLDAIAAAQQEAIQAINEGYENRYKARTSSVVDEAANSAKKEAKIAAYKQMNYTSRVKYIMDNLVTVLGEGASLDKVNYDDVRYAAENFDDPTKALLYIKDKVVSSGGKTGSSSSSSNGSSSSSSSSDSGLWSAWQKAFNGADYTGAWNGIMSS